MKRTNLREFIISIMIILWTVICGIKVYENYSHYTLLDWLIIVIVILIPYVIAWLLMRKKCKKQSQETATFAANTPYTASNTSTTQINIAQKLANNSINQLNETLSSSSTIKVNVKNANIAYPEEVLRSMRTAYSPMQAQEDIRILNDCISLLRTTTNLDTFFSRYELALQKIMTLEQAKAAGILMNLPITSDYVMSLKGRADEVLQSTYDKELKEIDKLKTADGKKNRIDKFILRLSEYYDEFEFSSTYRNIINSLNLYKEDL